MPRYRRQISSYSEDLKGLPRPPELASYVDDGDNNEALERNVLILATGGTLCMKKNADGAYEPMPRYIPNQIKNTPELHDQAYFDKNIKSRSQCEDTFVLPKTQTAERMAWQAQYEGCQLEKRVTRVVYTMYEYTPLIDSANMRVEQYRQIANDIATAYCHYDGFVILHGTDTMAYTASTLSFMLENLGKPVVLTGAQVPGAEMRSDAFDNILGSLVVAGNYKIPEVTVFFNRKLFRGNRVQKVDCDEYDAFNSPKVMPLVKMGIKIKVNQDLIWRHGSVEPFRVVENWDCKVALLRIFPAMTALTLRAFLASEINGVVLQTYGAGNGPSERKDILEELKLATSRGMIIVNVTQCHRGTVTTAYAAGKELERQGIMGGSDMTAEAALAKLSYICGMTDKTIEQKRKLLASNLRGELTPDDETNPKVDTQFVLTLAKHLSIGTEAEMQNLRESIYPPLLCNAARKGDISALRGLRQHGADYNCADYDQRTPLHVACAEGNYAIVEELIRKGASIHAKDRYGRTPLHDSIEARHFKIIKFLVQAGAVIKPQTSIGSQLCRLAIKHDINGIRAWVAAGMDLNTADYDGRTALHITCSTSNLELCEYLMCEGADPSVCDNNGSNSMTDAVNKNNIEVIKVLRSSILTMIEELTEKMAAEGGRAGVSSRDDDALRLAALKRMDQHSKSVLLASMRRKSSNTGR